MDGRLRLPAVDVLACPRCDARLEVIAYVTQPEVAKQILDHLGLASQGPPVASARAPPDAEPARPDARGGRVPLQAPCPRPGVVETRPRRAGELTQAIDEYGPSGAGGAAAYVEKAEVERARGARREVLQLPCPLPGRVRGLTGF